MIPPKWTEQESQTSARFAPEIDIESIRERLSVVLAAKYRIVKQLAAGGMSTIWLARHRVHGGLYAIKVLHPSLAGIPEVLQAFYHEAIHTAALSDHPNIVPVFDLDRADGLHYIVMPYVRGYDLDEVMQRYGPLRPSDALCVSLEITRTLAYAENRGIMHGDLTPGNVRIDNFGRVLLLDFGLSRPLHVPELQSSYVLGTPYAMSPEQIRGEQLDVRSDLYSLGILLFQMLTGKPPFENETTGIIEKWHLEGKLNIPAEILENQKSLAQLLRRLLAKSPNDRPSSAQSFEDELLHMGATSYPLRIFPAHTPEAAPNSFRRRLSTVNNSG